MDKIKSLDDLKRMREEAMKKRDATTTSGKKQVVIGMGTVGIAAGARETLKAILDLIEQENLSDVVVRQTGNIGIDSWEPVVQVMVQDQPQVNYGKVTPEVARRIIKEHLQGGKIVEEFVIPS